MRSVSPAQARRIAVAAQGLAAPTADDAALNLGHLQRQVDRLGLLQIDSVNVLARAHYLPLFSRLGVYPTGLLDEAAWSSRPAKRRLVETWAHEASLIPVRTEPMMRWRRKELEDGKWRSARGLLDKHPGFVEQVLAVISDSGPISAGEVERMLEAGRGEGGWWGWSNTKVACEFLFATGVISTAHRRGFARCYDLTERVLPPSVLATPTPSTVDAKRGLVEISAAAHGIGTPADLADYFRLPVAETKAALLELTEAGVVEPVTVPGWRDTTYLHTAARLPRRTSGAALLCPFDPLVWFRQRTERLFDFHYRIEIYTPAEKRIFGYYVFPLLVDDVLVGRLDLKADRAAGQLLVQSAWLEPGVVPVDVAERAVGELKRMARWLGLDEVVIVGRGDFAPALAGEL
ncbi:winged helix-turn-helix domain-containing protein [Nakamurella silvestris]|nr:winged helix-turn-helix domain-containing protein [Nakamurella silvestris]